MDLAKLPKQVGDVLKDPKNKNALIASTVVFTLSKENKERNALVAGLLAYALLDGNEEEEE